MAITRQGGGFVDYTTDQTPYTLTLPEGVQEGDVLVIGVARRQSAALALPDGIAATIMDSLEVGFTDRRLSVYVWVAPTTPPASLTWGLSTPAQGSVAWEWYRGVDTAAPLAADVEIDHYRLQNNTVVPLPAITTTSDAAMVIAGCALESSGRVINVHSPAVSAGSSGGIAQVAITEGVQATAGPVAATTSLLSLAEAWTGSRRIWRTALRPAPGDPTGPVVQFSLTGAVTDTSARVNARIPGGPAPLQVSTDPNLTGAAQTITGQATADDVWTYHVTGLTPDTVYHYGIDGARAGQFRTFPPEGQPASFTLAGGSCNSTASASPVFGRILARNPILFHHMGDWGYADIPTNDNSLYRQAYKDNLGTPAQAALFANTAMSYTWDDHDFGPNNSTGHHVGKPSAQQAYREYVPHYPLPADTRPGGKGEIYQTYVIARVRHIVLDCKSERDEEEAPDNATKSTLGADQKAWLKETLLAATEPLIILEVSEPWIASGGTMDGWGMYTTERAELSQFFEDHDLTRRLLIWHGDAHMLAADDGTNSNYAPTPSSPKGPPVFNFAPLDRTNSIKGGPYTEGTHTGSQTQYGTLDITDDGQTITVLGRGWQVNGGTETNVLSMTTTYEGDPVPVLGGSGLTNPTGRWVKPALRPIWHDGTAWRAILPTSMGHRLDTLTPAGITAGDIIDDRLAARPTAVHTAGATYVLTGHPSETLLHVLDAGLAVAGTFAVPLTAADLDASPIVLHHSPNGSLWAAVGDGTGIKVTRSTDNGATWATPVTLVTTTQTAIVAIGQAGTTVVLVATGNTGEGRWVRTIDQDAATIAAGGWAAETLPDLPAGVTSDDHLSILQLPGRRLLIASKTTDATEPGELSLYSCLRQEDGTWVGPQPIELGPEDAAGYSRPALTLAGALPVIHYGAWNAPFMLSRRTLDLDTLEWSPREHVPGLPSDDSASVPETPPATPWPVVAHERATGDIALAWSTVWGDPPEHPMYVGTRRVIEVRLGRLLAGTFP